MNERQKKVAEFCDGIRTSKEIALLCGDKHKYVQEVMLQFDLPRRKRGSSFGAMNGAYKTGRRIDRDGYVLISAPIDHPYSRKRSNRITGLIYEHRHVMEVKLGRYLDPKEVIDHIDGLRLHNDPDNLRLFESNSAHLKATISGQIPTWSNQGQEKLNSTRASRIGSERVDTYDRMKKCGDARLRQILLAMLSLGVDSPYLLGSSHHLEKAGIVDLSHSNLELELEKLYQRYA